MTMDKISPDEMKALLGQRGTEDNNMSRNSLLKVEKEALYELLTISLGGSSNVLADLFSAQVEVTASDLSIKQKDEILTGAIPPYLIVLGEYAGGVNGIQLLTMNMSDVKAITNKVDPSSEEEDMQKQFQVIQEVIQQMFISVSESMTTVINQDVSHSLSGLDVIANEQDLNIAAFTEEQDFVQTGFHLKIGSEKHVTFHIYIPVGLAKQMIGLLPDTTGEESSQEVQELPTDHTTTDAKEERNSGSTPKIQPVQFSSFDEVGSTGTEPNNLNMLLDIPLQVTVELGRTKRMVKEVLEISHGSIIELDKLAGEPVDILVNNKLIAVGEVVVIDENFGVRVTDILSAKERMTKIR